MDGTPILVVEDDLSTALMLRRILGGAGYAVSVAPHGRAALDLLEQGAGFQAVLLDRRMPDMDGLQVLRHMKGREALADIPVVLETVLDQDAEVQEGLKAGAYYYLVKPLVASLVLQVMDAAVREAAERRRVREAMASVRLAMDMILHGTFRYRTLQQCYDLAALLAKACPDPKRTGVGLGELMINALEHGNLGIGYAEKSLLIERDAWSQEVQRRQELPENREKWVAVDVLHSPERTRFRIQDRGAGFPWREYQELNPERMFDNHGRGIILARYEAFDEIRYVGCGNCVVAEVHRH